MGPLDHKPTIAQTIINTADSGKISGHPDKRMMIHHKELQIDKLFQDTPAKLSSKCLLTFNLKNTDKCNLETVPAILSYTLFDYPVHDYVW